MRLTRKLSALKTTFNILALSTFPENTAPLVFSRSSELIAYPFTSKTSILFKSKHWTKTTINTTNTKLFLQLIAPN